MTYYGKDLAGAHLPFNFQLIHATWKASEIARLVEEYEGALPQGGWPNWVLGNHDQPRIAARVGNAQARVAGMLLLTLRGTPTLYYGDELGIGRVPIPVDAVQDPWEKNEPGLGFGRDPSRTPMQWNAESQAGFSTAKSWLPLAADYAVANVETMRDDKHSMLTFYRALIALRRERLSLSIGTFKLVAATDAILAYQRSHGGETVLIALNFTDEIQSLDGVETGSAQILLSTALDRVGEWDRRLGANEGLILAVHT